MLAWKLRLPGNLLVCFRKVNALSKDVQTEFEECFNKASRDPNVHSMVIKSGKPGCFIAGADIG